MALLLLPRLRLFLIVSRVSCAAPTATIEDWLWTSENSSFSVRLPATREVVIMEFMASEVCRRIRSLPLCQCRGDAGVSQGMNCEDLHCPHFRSASTHWQPPFTLHTSKVYLTLCVSVSVILEFRGVSSQDVYSQDVYRRRCKKYCGTSPAIWISLCQRSLSVSQRGAENT